MKPLNLRKALELCDLLGKYIPITPCQNDLDFIDIIINNIISENKHEDFVNSLLLMTKASKEDLLQLKPNEVVSLFIECLAANKILDLVEFCNKVDYHG